MYKTACNANDESWEKKIGTTFSEVYTFVTHQRQSLAQHLVSISSERKI